MWKDTLHCSPSDHPEFDSSPLLSEAQHCLYQNLVGMAEWAVQIGRFDICYAITSLNRFSAAPWEVHLTFLVKIFGYLQNFSGECRSIAVLPEYIGDISGKGANTKDWLEKGPGDTEEIDDVLPDPRGHPLSTSVYFDSNHAHDQVTRRLVSGVLSCVGSPPIRQTSNRHVTIKSSSYSAELCAGRLASEEVIALRYMLRSLGVPIIGSTELCGDNLVMIIYCTNLDL